jgi:hypothetical protein
MQACRAQATPPAGPDSRAPAPRRPSALPPSTWGSGARAPGLRLAAARGPALLILLNAAPVAVSFALPTVQPGSAWEVCLDTRAPGLPVPGTLHLPGESVELLGQSLMCLRSAGARPPASPGETPGSLTP